MYEILNNYLANGTYTFADAQSRIDYGVARGKLSAAEAETLLAVAMAHATPDASVITTAELAARVENTEAALMELAALIGGDA